MLNPNTQSNSLLITWRRDTFCLEEVLAGNMTALDVTTHAQGSLCNTKGTVKDVRHSTSLGMFSLEFSMLSQYGTDPGSFQGGDLSAYWVMNECQEIGLCPARS